MATNSSVRPDLTTPRGQPREFRESQKYGKNLVPEATGDIFRSLYIKGKPIPSDHRLFALHPKTDTFTELGLALFMNSSLAACSRELLSRSNLGQGGLTTDGIDWLLMPVPDLQVLTKIAERFGKLDGLFKRRIGPIAEEVKQLDKMRLDEIILEAIGLPKKVRETLANETVALVRRRIEKAASVKPEGRRKRIEAAEKTRSIWAGLPPEEEDEE